MTPLFVTLVVYILISVPLFYLVFISSQLVVDEEFHLRQGRHYCMGDFHIVSFPLVSMYIRQMMNSFDFFQWDSKITTFPGLYVLSSIFLLPLKICSTFALRLTSLFASVLNVFLIFEIRRIFQHKVRSFAYFFLPRVCN